MVKQALLMVACLAVAATSIYYRRDAKPCGRLRRR
jgi:hypothetical protein